MRGVRRAEFPTPQAPGYPLYLFAGALIIVCVQVIIFLYVMGSIAGPFTFFARREPPHPSMVRELAVTLLRSESTAKLYAEKADAYDALIARWEKALRRANLAYRLSPERQLIPALKSSTVLILPGATCLGTEEQQAIMEFVKAGNGVVASGALGTRARDGRWLGWNFLTRLTDAQDASTITPRSPVYLCFRGQSFFSERVPTGYRLKIPSHELVLLTADDPDVYWSDWRLRPGQGESYRKVAVGLHSVCGEGRVVWLGFNESLVDETVIEAEMLDHYLSSAVLWAGRQPTAILANWPAGRQAAALVAEEVRPAQHDTELCNLLQQTSVPATFFIASDEADTNSAALNGLGSVGEIAALGDSMQPLAGEILLRQAGRLRWARQELERVVGRRVDGFAPPLGLTDTATVVALNEAGYRYYLNEMGVTRATPEIVEFTSSVFFPFQKAEVAKIFRIASDDFEVIANYPGPSPPSLDLAEGFLADFRRVLYLGGVYTLYFRSYLLGAPPYRHVLAHLLSSMQSDSVWMTTASQLASWWSARQKVEVETRKITTRRLRLDIANKGEAGLEQATVYLYLPYRPRKVSIHSVVSRLQAPRCRLLDHDDVLRVDLAKLGPQTNYTYVVALDE